MFARETVFVLGAGASWHYGYPTGEDLVKKVILAAGEFLSFQKKRGVYDRIAQGELTCWPRLVYEKLNYPSDITGVKLGKIRDSWSAVFKDCRDLELKLRSINPPVIDYFLGKNPSLGTIGKFFISWVLLECEKNSFAGSMPHGNYNSNKPQSDRFDGKDDWYRFLLQKILEDCNGSEDLCKKNNVTFITFNYDLSLEKHLYNGFHNTEILQPQDKIIDFFTDTRFIHVYGKINSDFANFDSAISGVTKKDNSPLQEALYWQNKINTIYDASQNIRTIDQIDKDSEQGSMELARKALNRAEDVYILGFGFDKKNCERIGLDTLYARMSRSDSLLKNIYFTNYENKNQINKRAGILFHKDSAVFTTKYIAGLCEKSTGGVYSAIERDFDFF